MKKLILIVSLFATGCAGTMGPHNEMANEVWKEVRWVQQEPNKYDQQYLGCRPFGDCDDQALCAACKLLGKGANIDDIIVVYQGWNKGSGLENYNHLSIEYKGECIMSYSNSIHRAYMGKCEHRYANDKMVTARRSLKEYMRLFNVKNICPFLK